MGFGNTEELEVIRVGSRTDIRKQQHLRGHRGREGSEGDSEAVTGEAGGEKTNTLKTKTKTGETET